jgi:hypothetical protein
MVMVHFSSRSNFHVFFFGQTPLGRPPTSFPTNQTLCKCPCCSLLLCFKVASMSSITKDLIIFNVEKPFCFGRDNGNTN